jgi:hypothetical protein
MTKLGVSFVVALATPFFSTGARAGGDPLLVVVESAPGADVGPVDVRQAIAMELRAPVVAPRQPGAVDSDKLLVVALDSGAIRMSLRTGTGQAVSRTIPAPPERPARLRAIGWLAGNLARDQVGGIVEAPPARPSPGPRTIAAADLPPVIPPAREPPTRAEDTTPTPAEAAPSSSPGGLASVRATAAPVAPGPQWAVTAAAGPTLNIYMSNNRFLDSHVGGPRDAGSIYQIAVQRWSAGDGLTYGAAFDVGNSIYDFVGVAGLVGTRWQHRRWFLEGSVGIGPELVQLPTHNERLTTSSATGGPVITDVVTMDEHLALHVSGIGVVGVPISRMFDLVAKVDLRLTSAGSETDFLSGSLGLRVRLP